MHCVWIFQMRLNKKIKSILLAKRMTVVFSLTLGSIAIIIGGYTAYWFIASSTIEKRIIKWADTQKKKGLLFDVNVSEVTGYPLKFEVRFLALLFFLAGITISWRRCSCSKRGKSNIDFLIGTRCPRVNSLPKPSRRKSIDHNRAFTLIPGPN